ncbi:MAG: FeoB-associated Cys-rich membrane protein [Ruminococcus sp.]|nr:FeoB-associated Cys-rich membrane protein [Ruminococcus sp.]
MLEFLISNMGTIIVLIVLVAVVGLIIFKMKKDKKQGKSSCGCKCSACPNSQYCHGFVKNQTTES